MFGNENYKKLTEIVDLLSLSPGDILLIGSDITELAYQSYKNNDKFEIDKFINLIIDKIGIDGTLLFPTFNWDFCTKKYFDINKTPSLTGALSKAALRRDDFIRTKHPIYSFAVWGKDSKLLSELSNVSSFGSNSPFAYLHLNKAKMIIIGLEYHNSFTFAHYVEEMEGVKYRYLKEFTGKYIDNKGKSSIRTYSMNVRNLDMGVINNGKELGKIFEKKNISKHLIINNVDFSIIDLCKAYGELKKDIHLNGAKSLHVVSEGILR